MKKLRCGEEETEDREEWKKEIQDHERRKYEDNPDSSFTPLPRDITPLGIELDPTTGADLSNTDKK